MPHHISQDRLGAQQRAGRSMLRRWLETRGLLGDLRAPHRDVRLVTRDGVRLAASLLPGPDPAAPAVVLGHGFAAHRRKPAYALLADVLAGSLHVLTIDHRGHGESSGRSTLGDLERFDVAAAVQALRRNGHDHVILIGFSMGATSVIHALGDGLEVEGAIVVSAPARVHATQTDAMAGLDDMWRTWWKRIPFQAVAGIRMVGPDGFGPMDHPRDLIARSEVPLLVVHGEDDHFFGLHHAEELVSSAAGPAELWCEPAGFGHAEDGITPDLASRFASSVRVLLSEGRFPSRGAAAP